MNFMVFDGFGGMVVWLPIGAPNIHDMFISRSCMCMCLGGMCIVMSRGQLCQLPTFIRVFVWVVAKCAVGVGMC